MSLFMWNVKNRKIYRTESKLVISYGETKENNLKKKKKKEQQQQQQQKIILYPLGPAVAKYQ